MEDSNLIYKSITNATPMLAQYLEAKADCQDCLLLFRLGDFYELFFEDAKIASTALNIVLTHRGKSEGDDIPMCGIPVASMDYYVAKLIKSGYKVAVCDQMESPEDAKKRGYKAIVRREVTRIISAGTIIDDNLLNQKENNYLMSIVPAASKRNSQILLQEMSGDISFALIDISTGSFLVNTVSYENLGSVLEQYSPKEIIISLDADKLIQHVSKISDALITKLPPSKFNPEIEKNRLKKYFKVDTLDSFEINSKSELACCGSILEYLLLTQKSHVSVLPIPKKIQSNQYLIIDASTSRSLEIMASNNPDNSRFTLLNAIDHTKTAFGARALASRLAMPIVDIDVLKQRQQYVQNFINNPDLVKQIRDILAGCPDFERSINRIRFNKFSQRDVENVRDALELVFSLKKILSNIAFEDNRSFKDMSDFSDLRKLLQSALIEKYVTGGNVIADGYSRELDQYRLLKNQGEKLMNDLQNKYIYRTGINTLKVRNNAIIGWYVEIPASQKNKIIPEFMHRQTLVNNIRYTTDEIMTLQTDIVKAEEECARLEQALYAEVIDTILNQYEDISYAVGLLALLDIYTNFATIAMERNYICPEIVSEPILEIENGKHPVLSLTQKDFTGNDCDLMEDSRICLLTGPNMAGKSTYLRQNALLVIMAQIGSFVPADKAKIGIVDRLFSRIGAADDLAHGRSTFMVEMIETATILNQATDKSFVILDEVGRGTSTYDGLSIAWAVIESLRNNNRCRVLFATHYRELTSLRDNFPDIRCKTLRVQEWEGKVVFHHKIIDGIADKSYGLHVATIAGVPQNVIKRADELLKQMESGDNKLLSFPIAKSAQNQISPYSESAPKASEVVSELKNLNLNEITPLQALNLLMELKQKAEKEVLCAN